MIDIRCSAEKKVIPPRGKAIIDTQISIAVPPGTYGRIAPRSGLGEFSKVFLLLLLTEVPAAKYSIDTGAGVIDADYRGILLVLLFNLGDQEFEGPCHDFFCAHDFNQFTAFFPSSVNEGDRIAQLILERIYTPEISEVDVSQARFFVIDSPMTSW